MQFGTNHASMSNLPFPPSTEDGGGVAPLPRPAPSYYEDITLNERFQLTVSMHCTLYNSCPCPSLLFMPSLRPPSWQHSLGGSYFGYPWRLPAVQRLRRQTRVGTIASTGAANSGEMRLQCEILGLLQRGCLGDCALQGSDGTTHLHEVRTKLHEYRCDAWELVRYLSR